MNYRRLVIASNRTMKFLDLRTRCLSLLFDFDKRLSISEQIVMASDPSHAATAATNVQYPRNEHYEIANFRKMFKEMSKDASKTEETSSEEAAHKHVALAGLTARFLDSANSLLDDHDRAFLRSEVTARLRQALMLRSIVLGGFAEAMLSLGTVRRLNQEIRDAKLRPTDDDDVDLMAETTDPRTHTEGLYEYMAYDPKTKLDELPGYEEQRQRIVNAYYVLEDRDDDESGATNVLARRERESSGGDEMSLRSKVSRAGSNVILYGPPGTGKTVSVRAVAHYLRLDFVFVNSENIASAYRSETEKNLRKLYVKMRALVQRTGRNVVLLIDEVDGLVKNRSSEIGSADYSLLTTILRLLEPNDGTNNFRIMSVFTTNLLYNLDDAFQRRCTKIFFGHVVHRDAQLRLISHFFTSSLQIPAVRDERVTLETNFSIDRAITTEPDIERIVETTRDWVPGDYVRFAREILRPMRLREYLRQRGITEMQFYSQASVGADDGESNDTAASNTSRTINVKLPKISIAQLREATRMYQPTTTMERYLRDFPIEAELEAAERAREARN